MNVLRVFVRAYAAAGSIMLLGSIVVDLFTTGNVQISGGPAHAMNTLNAMLVTLWLCCTLACVALSIPRGESPHV